MLTYARELIQLIKRIFCSAIRKGFVQMVQTFLVDENGATAAEYAVLLTLITAVLIAAVQVLGTAISAVFNTVATQLSARA